MGNTVRIICLGDCVGRPGRNAITRALKKIRNQHKADLVIANGENAAGGLGIDPATAKELQAAGVDVITSGDHAYNKKSIFPFLKEHADWCIRPENFPPGAPGVGWCIVTLPSGIKVGVCNVLGRVFMDGARDCPFRALDYLMDEKLAEATIKIVDAHAEATSEKIALGLHVDGRASLVVGTHTHVQTSDERITTKGTGLLTDLGMCGSQDGVIGMDRGAALTRFVAGMPAAYEVAEGDLSVQGVLVECNASTGRALHIERIRESVQ